METSSCFRRTIVFLAGTLLLLSAFTVSAADTPREIGGFRLGAALTDYKDAILPETAMPVRHSEYLEEVDLLPPAGYKSGYLTCGKCDKPDQVFRIKLKYAREDKEFFNELMERFNKKFGKPSEYRGDAFRACLAWKWSFTEEAGDRVNLMLEHNCEQDDEINGGNSVKLTLRSAIEKERACFDKKSRQPAQGQATEDKATAKPDFNTFIPN